MQELNRNTVLFASKGGGTLDLVDEQTGEILAQMFVPEGRSKATKWLDLAGPGQELQVGDNLIALEPSHRIRVQTFGEEAHASAANPEYRVTSAMRQSRELDRRLLRLEVAASRLRASEEVSERVEASKAVTPPDPSEAALVTPAGDKESSPVIEDE